jgi:hypothetical protein
VPLGVELANGPEGAGALTEVETVQPIKFRRLGELRKGPEGGTGWLVDRAVPLRGGLFILGGQPKHGKSDQMHTLARSVVRGEPWNGRDTQQGRVLVFALEDQEELLRADLEAIGLDPEDPNLGLHVGSGFGVDPGVKPEDDLRELQKVMLRLRAAIELERPSLVLIDILRCLVPIRDITGYGEMAAKLGIIGQTARDTGCTIGVSHHAPKNGFKTLLGSVALSGGVDTALFASRTGRGPDHRYWIQTLGPQRYGADLPRTEVTRSERPPAEGLSPDRQDHLPPSEPSGAPIKSLSPGECALVRDVGAHPGTLYESSAERVGCKKGSAKVTLNRLARTGHLHARRPQESGGPTTYWPIGNGGNDSASRESVPDSTELTVIENVGNTGNERGDERKQVIPVSAPGDDFGTRRPRLEREDSPSRDEAAPVHLYMHAGIHAVPGIRQVPTEPALTHAEHEHHLLLAAAMHGERAEVEASADPQPVDDTIAPSSPLHGTAEHGAAGAEEPEPPQDPPADTQPPPVGLGREAPAEAPTQGAGPDLELYAAQLARVEDLRESNRRGVERGESYRHPKYPPEFEANGSLDYGRVVNGRALFPDAPASTVCEFWLSSDEPDPYSPTNLAHLDRAVSWFRERVPYPAWSQYLPEYPAPEVLQEAANALTGTREWSYSRIEADCGLWLSWLFEVDIAPADLRFFVAAHLRRGLDPREVVREVRTRQRGAPLTDPVRFLLSKARDLGEEPPAPPPVPDPIASPPPVRSARF